MLDRPLYESRFGLRLLYCGRYVCEPNWRIESDRLPGGLIGFFYVERNGCWVEINGRRVNLVPGDLQILRGGAPFRMGHAPARPLTALSLALAVEQGAVPNLLQQRKFASRYRLREPRRYREAFDAVLTALQSPVPTRDWAVNAAVLQWLIVVLEETNAPLQPHSEAGHSGVDRVFFAQAWANARLASVITLAEWARATGWHPVHFARVFKQQTGLNPIRWLEERRMAAARQYLSGTSKTVSEIAEAIGYTDPFYFSRVFRKHYGQPPRRYRTLSFNGS
ncbi:MAG: HTH-type transcriptional activator RhaR [Verrucomicrobiae bacterium]|nr:HTH-type transcriptional activator RhaR [Verrucomicrobiae bacterium]